VVEVSTTVSAVEHEQTTGPAGRLGLTRSGELRTLNAWLAAAQDPQRLIGEESPVESLVESRSVFAEVWACLQRCQVCDQCW
jgi:hypothetical protein